MGGLLSDGRMLVQAAWLLDRRRVVEQICLQLLTGLVGGANLLLLVPIVNSISQPSQQIVLPGMGRVTLSVPLPVLLGCFVALMVAQAWLTRSATVNATSVQQELVDSLRHEAFRAVLAARWSFVLAQRTSDIIEVVTAGAARCGIAYQQLLKLSITVVIALATAAVTLVVSPVVGTLSLFGVAILGAAQAAAIRPAYRMGRNFGTRNRKLQGVMTDSMASLRLVRAHDAGQVWVDGLATAFADTREAALANTRRQATVKALSDGGTAAAAALLVAVAVWQEVPPSQIALTLLLVSRLARNVALIVSTAAVVANAIPAVRDLHDLTEQAHAAVEVPAGSQTTRRELSCAAGEPLLAFRDVTFTYPNSQNGIRELSLQVPRGDITVLVGHSGAGKTTTADLALGLLTPQSGDVLVDGEPLTPADLPWWRQHVAYVPQETILVPGTLRENLVWSIAQGATDDQCWTALDRASATFARRLPDGLDTNLGDRGVRLSGGERQRVAIARALLRNPDLLVLDEATSSLDDRTEAAVLDLVANLVPAVTVLVIAHRKSTIAVAQHRVELARGRLVGAGATAAEPG